MMFRSVTLAFGEFSYYLSEQIKSLPGFCLKQMEKGQLALTGRQGWLPMKGLKDGPVGLRGQVG